MPELEPITREEKFLNGEVGMTPITREEKILAGEDIETVTRREYFLKKYRGGGGGDVTVVPLSVTENGTYSEEGKAYSPVSVNIPLPSNAYLLKSVANLPQPIATFNDGADAPMKSLKVAIEPQQDLHGYDSPWVGGAGKNKFDVDLPHQSVSGSLTYTYNLTLKPNTTYTMSSNVPQDSPASLYFNGGTTYINGVWNGTPRTFTSDENGNLVAYVRYDDTQGGIDLYTAVKNGQYYIQLEEGSTATTFAPYSNICPISGWSEVDLTRCGKNLFGGEGLANKVVATITGATKDTTNKTVTYSGQNASGKILFSTFKADTRYTFIYYMSSGYTNLCIEYTDGTVDALFNDVNIYTSANGKSIKCLRGQYQSGISVLLYEQFGIFEGVLTTADFEPYAGSTYTIDLDGTRYGGVLDVVSGVLTVDRAYVDLGSLNWTHYDSGTKHLFYAKIDDKKNGAFNNDLCEIYKAYPRNINSVATASSVLSDKEFAGFSNDNYDYSYIFVRDDDFTDAPTYTSAVDGKKLVYELKSPTTFETLATPIKSLLGSNNVWADTGDITDAEYFSKEV